MRAILMYLIIAIHLLLASVVVFYRYFYYVVKGNKKNYKEIYKYTNLVFGSVLKIGQVKYNVEGYENVENLENGFLIVPNHQSYFDIPIVSLAFKEKGASFISKDAILKVPIISHYMKVMDCLFLDRDSVKSGMDMIKNGSRLLKEGVNLVIFPEGTRADHGVMREFKSGSLKIATRAKAPIVPVSISHSYDLHPSSLVMKKGTATIVIHPPISYEAYNELNANELNDLVESTVRNKVIQ